MVLYVKIIKKLKKKGGKEKKISISIYKVIKHIYHLMKLQGVMSFFKKAFSFLAIGALVFRWTKASVTFVCKSCLTSAIMLAWSLSTSVLM